MIFVFPISTLASELCCFASRFLQLICEITSFCKLLSIGFDQRENSPLGTHGWVVRLELQRRYLLPHTLRNQRVQSLALVSSVLDDCTCCDNARILSSRLRLSSLIACERCATSWSRVLTIAREIIAELIPQNSTSECVIQKKSGETQT